VRRFTSTEYFVEVARVGSLRALRRAIDSGEAKVGLMIPEDFSQNLGADRPAPIQFVVDGSDSNTANIAIGNIASIARSTALSPRDLRPQVFFAPKAENPVPIELRTWVWYNPELKSSNFLIPGLTAVILMMLAAMVTSLTVAREWERGTMEGLIASPLRSYELMVGKILPYVVIGLVDVVLILLVGVLWFRVPLRGNLLLLMTSSTVFLLGGLGIGLFISATTKNQQVAFQLSTLTTMLPALLLSGFFYPIENMPAILRLFTYLIPARYFLVVIRGIFLRGVGLAILWKELLFLSLFAVLMLILSSAKFRKRLE